MRIQTSQNVEIDFEVAGLGDRVLAALLDDASRLDDHDLVGSADGRRTACERRLRHLGERNLTASGRPNANALEVAE